jgi:hypothetical protein
MKLRILSLLLLAAGACAHEDEGMPRVAPDSRPAADMMPPGGEAPEFVDDDPWRGESPQFAEDDPWRGDDVKGRDVSYDPDRPRWVIPVAGVGPYAVRGRATVFEDANERLMVSLSVHGLPEAARDGRVFVAESCAPTLPERVIDPPSGEPTSDAPHALGRLGIRGETERGYLLAELVPSDASAAVRSLLPTDVIVVRIDRGAHAGDVVACAPLKALEDAPA